MLDCMNSYSILVEGTTETKSVGQKSFRMTKDYIDTNQYNAIGTACDFIDGWMHELYKDDLVAINIVSIHVLAVMHDISYDFSK